MKAGGTPHTAVKEFWNGDIPFVLIEDMTGQGVFLSKTKRMITQEGLRNSSAWLVPANSLLVSMYATIGETAINLIPVATNQAIIAIVPRENFDVLYGAYFIKYDSRRLQMQNIQSTQKMSIARLWKTSPFLFRHCLYKSVLQRFCKRLMKRFKPKRKRSKHWATSLTRCCTCL